MDNGQGEITTIPAQKEGKLTLRDHAIFLENVTDAIEHAEELTPLLIKHFDEVSLSLSNKVDNWISYLEFVDSQHARIKQKVDKLRQTLASIDNHRTSLKSYLLHTVKSHPNLPFKGEEGKLVARRNSTKGVDYKIHFHPRLFERIIQAETEDIPDSYVTTHTIRVVNHEAVKDALEKGVELSWATLVQGEHLRII